MKNQEAKQRVFFDLNHPADFHFFKYLIRKMRDEGYDIRVMARDKECLHLLLDSEGIEYSSRGRGKHSLAGKYLYSVWILILLFVALIRFRPAIAMSLSSPYLAVLTRILGINCVTYDDTDDNPRLLPLIRKSTYLLSPATYPHKFHGNHFHLPALKELAYLHPDLFMPGQERKGVFFRLTRTDSVHHSQGVKPDLSLVLRKMEELSREQPVFLSSETELGADLVVRRADPVHIHHDLESCRVFWGNSATMAAEAAVLGIPAVFVCAEKFAYIKELEQYGLLYYYRPDELNASLERVDAILAGDPPDKQFLESRRLLLEEKINMTAFMSWFIEALPGSADTLKKKPDYIRKFISGM